MRQRQRARSYDVSILVTQKPLIANGAGVNRVSEVKTYKAKRPFGCSLKIG